MIWVMIGMAWGDKVDEGIVQQTQALVVKTEALATYIQDKNRLEDIYVYCLPEGWEQPPIEAYRATKGELTLVPECSLTCGCQENLVEDSGDEQDTSPVEVAEAEDDL